MLKLPLVLYTAPVTSHFLVRRDHCCNRLHSHECDEDLRRFSFVIMILTFRGSGLRKHPEVGLSELLQTERIDTCFPWSTWPVFTSSALLGWGS